MEELLIDSLFFMNYKNLMFILQIQNSHSASFLYFELLQVSARVQASQGGWRCSCFKIKCCYFSFLKQKHFDVFRHPLSDELNMQTSRLPRSLMDYITYGFFESNKNKANQKVHPTHTQKKELNSSLWSKGIVRVKERSLLPPLFAGSMSAPLR